MSSKESLTAPTAASDMDKVSAVVGSNLRRLREEKRMSLSEVARLSKMAKATLSNIERGIGNPTIETLVSLSNVLGVMPGDLMTSPAPQLIRASDGPFVEGPTTTGRLLTRHHSSSVDIHEVTFKAGMPFLSVQPESDAMEQLYVIEGKFQVKIAGETTTLSPGDLIQYPLKDGAEITAINKAAKALIIMAYTLRASQNITAFMSR